MAGIALVDVTGAPGYDEMQYAADELQRWVNKVLGVDIPIIYVNSIEELNVAKTYFVLGYDLAVMAGLNDNDLTTDTGYKIVNEGSAVYLYGRTKYGTLNAVYGFLEKYANMIFYTDTVYTYDDVSEIQVEIGNVKTFNPDIDYNWAADGLMTAIPKEYLETAGKIGCTPVVELGSYGNAEGWYPNWDYQRRLGYVNSWYMYGGNWHNFLSVITKAEYQAAHPNWFITETDTITGETFETLNITYNNYEMVEYVAKEFAEMIVNDVAYGKSVYIFSPPDHSGSLTATQYITFMNKLADYMDTSYTFDREITLLMLAYHNTLIAPSYSEELKFYSSDDIKLAVMYAPIEANMYRPLGDTTTSAYYNKYSNAYYLEQLQAWKAFGGEVYYWNYSTYYDNYFMPLDSINAMQGTYQALKENGVTLLLDLGQTGDLVSTDFAQLKLFLKSQLAKNVNADLNALISAFCDAYYGAGSSYMQTLLTKQRAWASSLASEVKYVTSMDSNGKYITTSGEAVGKHNGAGQLMMYKKYWDDELIASMANDSMLTSWYEYTTKAINAVNSDTMLTDAQKMEIVRRIEIEQLPILYLSARMFAGSGDVNNDGVTDTIAQVIEKAKLLGFTRFSESSSGTIDNLQ